MLQWSHWKVLSSFRKPITESAQGFPDSLQTDSGGLGALDCFAFSGLKGSIEILVHPFFCLSLCYLVLSLVFYFFSLSLPKFFFLGDKIDYLNKVVF